ncbi:L10-interacting MYB domain-containing protein [Bienertia sinuspersici]
MSNMNIEIKSEDEVVEIESTGGVGVWNECIETYFIGLIEDEVKKGNRPTTTLTKPAWKFIRQKLKEKTKKDYSQDQLSADDVVWTKLYEKHKSAKTFRKKGCKHYDKLCTIFRDTTATGGSSHPSTQSPSDTEEENETDGEVGNSEKEGEQGPKTKKAKANVNPKKLREKVNIAMADALVAMSENSKKKLELLERKMSTTNSTTLINESENSGNYLKANDQDLLMECIDTLSTLEGVDGASFAKATKLIHDDPLWRMIFLRLPDDRKKDFVLNI